MQTAPPFGPRSITALLLKDNDYLVSRLGRSHRHPATMHDPQRFGPVIMIVRERIPSGDYLTLLYIQVDDGVDASRRPAFGIYGLRHSAKQLDAREQAR